MQFKWNKWFVRREKEANTRIQNIRCIAVKALKEWKCACSGSIKHRASNTKYQTLKAPNTESTKRTLLPSNCYPLTSFPFIISDSFILHKMMKILITYGKALHACKQNHNFHKTMYIIANYKCNYSSFPWAIHLIGIREYTREEEKRRDEMQERQSKAKQSKVKMNQIIWSSHCISLLFWLLCYINLFVSSSNSLFPVDLTHSLSPSANKSELLENMRESDRKEKDREGERMR